MPTSVHGDTKFVRYSICHIVVCVTARCRCAVGNVGLKVGIEKVESHITRPLVEDFLEILHVHTQEGPRKMTLVKIGTGSKIKSPKGPFRILFWGHISAANKDIFTKFGEYVGNELPQGVEWFKHVSFENSIWQTAAMHHRPKCNL